MNTLTFSIILGLVIISFIFQAMTTNVYASPSFPRQEIDDPSSDWIDLKTQSSTDEGGETLSDILRVNYFSNGKTLNATIWLKFPFSPEPESDELTYGMLIDADANERTGVRGVDYVIETKWKNNNWIKTTSELSTHGETKTLSQHEGFGDFFEVNKRFVTISTNLEEFGSPEKYKVAFFTHEIANTTLHSEGVADFTKWVHIPAPEFIISTEPSSVEVRAGEMIAIQVFVESTSGFEPEVFLSTSRNDNFELEFSPPTFNIPSHGLSSTILNIKVFEDATVEGQESGYPYPFLIYANATFPTDLTESQVLQNSEFFIPELEGETISEVSRLTINVTPPLSFEEKFFGFIGRADVLFSFIITAATIINGALLLRGRRKKKRT